MQKKKKFGFPLFADDNANEREMKGISAAGALVASPFSNTTPSKLRLKLVRPVLNVTNKIHYEISHNKLNAKFR
jgi:hypothetical protein